MASSDFYMLVKTFLEAHVDSVLLALAIISLLTLMVFISVNVKLAAVTRRYNQLMRGMDGKNLEQLLESYISDVRAVKDGVGLLEEKVQQLEAEGKLSVKKIKFKRYNAFFDMGGDLSFSVVLLNDYNSGVLITSIYARDENRIYLKPIIKGSCSYTLSPEEKEIIAEAIGG